MQIGHFTYIIAKAKNNKILWYYKNNIDSYYYDFERKTCVIVFDNKSKLEFDIFISFGDTLPLDKKHISTKLAMQSLLCYARISADVS